MSGSEATPPPSSGRTRRSAAVKGKSAWASLLPQKHKSGGVSSDVDSDNNTEEPAAAPVPTKKESPKKAQVPVETVSQKRARVSGKKPRLTKAEKVNSIAGTSPSETTAAAVKTPEVKPSVKVTSSSPAKPAVVPAVSSPSPIKKENANPNVAPKPAASPAPKHTLATAPPVGAVRSYRTPQQGYSMNAAALNKEQLQEIEREVDKHLDGEFDGNEEEDDDDDDQDEGPTKFVLDDPDDEDFNLSSKKTTKRSGGDTSLPSTTRTYTPRGQSSGRGRGRPKGSLNIPKPAGIMRGVGKISSRPSSLGTPPSIMAKNNSLARPPTSNGTTAAKQKPFVVSSSSSRTDVGGGDAASNGQVDRRNLKVVRIRTQTGQPQQGAPHRGGPGGTPFVSHSQGPALATSLNKEISETAEKYHNRVVPGTTVQQFNDIVNQLSQELMRMVSEQTNHRQYTEQLAITHATEMELKDEKIRHLEHTIEVLQSKLLVSFKRNQLNVLKHETRPQSEPTATADKQQEDKPNGGVIYGSSPTEMQKKRTGQNADELEPSRKVARFNKNYDDEEEPFSGSGLEGDDEEDTEVDEEAARQVTL